MRRLTEMFALIEGLDDDIRKMESSPERDSLLAQIASLRRQLDLVKSGRLTPQEIVQVGMAAVDFIHFWLLMSRL